MACSSDLTANDFTTVHHVRSHLLVAQFSADSFRQSVLGRIDAGSGDSKNLWGSIDRDNCTGLNVVLPESVPAIIRPWDQRNEELDAVESLVDEGAPEILIQIPFIESVRVTSVLLKCGE